MRKFLLPSFISIISFIYYAYQACPTFYFWDSGELTAAVLGGGVPHPPGFPSLLILAKLWIWIVPVEKAYGLNLLSSLLASFGLAIWYLVASTILQRAFPAKNKTQISILSLITILIIGSSFSYSIQAVRFEVYSLNFLCFALLLYFSLKLSFDKSVNGLLYLITMISIAAISLGGHHLTIALTFPGIILLLFNYGRLKLRNLTIFALFTLILLIPLYFYIYLLAKGNPVLNWGDPSNLSNFLDYFFLKEFSTPLSSLAPIHLADNLAFWVSLVLKQLGVLGSLLALWGIVKFIRIIPKLAIPLIVIVVLNIFSILYFKDYFYENYDLHGYLLFSIAVLTLFMTLIIGFLSDRLTRLLRERISGKSAIPGILITIFIAGLILYMPLKKNLYSADLSRIKAAEEYAGLYLNDISKNSIVIASYYNTYFCLLAYQALYLSEDDRIITNVYNWDYEWGRNQTAALLNYNPGEISSNSDFYRALLNTMKDKKPIYVEYDNASAPLVKFLKPAGLGYKFSISDTSLTDPYAQIMEIERYSKIALKYGDIESLRTWIFWFQNRGEYYLKRGEKASANRYFEAVERIASARR